MLLPLDAADQDDVCVVGFGFAGLATLAQLVRRDEVRRVSVVATDDRGLGVAYGTEDPAHLLNVRAERMGGWADRQDDFARWLGTDGGIGACRELGVAVPGRTDFAPRALYGRYLAALREATLAGAARQGMAIRFVAGEATGLRRRDGGWTVEVDGAARVRAATCVLAVGHEARRTLAGEGVLRGAAGVWHARGADAAPADGTALIAGTGLSAVDAVLSLRSTGFRGEIVLASRRGLLPRPHCAHHRPYAFTADRLDRLRCAADVRDLVLETIDAGRDWRLALEGLRPHTQRVWRQFGPDAQREVVERWSAVWSAHRHRMAPAVAARLDAERTAGTLRVVAGRVQTAAASPSGPRSRTDGRFGIGGAGVTIARTDGGTERLLPDVTIDCTGADVDWRRSARPLLRGLLVAGHCAPHHTGLGVRAEDGHRIGSALFAVGSALTGELWESVAVPELREQAAAVAAAVVAPAAAQGVAA